MGETEAFRQAATTREKEIVAAEDKVNDLLFGSASRRRRTQTVAAIVLLSIVSAGAAEWVGFDVGWLIGASASPIAQAVAPAIFGLVAALGVGSRLWKRSAVGSQRKRSKRAIILGWRTRRYRTWEAILAALLVLIFCQSLYRGIERGIASRTLPYAPLPDLLPEWDTVDDDELATDILAFRARARDGGLPHDAYDLFMVDVVGGILRDGEGDESIRIRNVMAIMEKSFRKPPPSDEKLEPKSPSELAGGKTP